MTMCATGMLGSGKRLNAWLAGLRAGPAPVGPQACAGGSRCAPVTSSLGTLQGLPKLALAMLLTRSVGDVLGGPSTSQGHLLPGAHRSYTCVGSCLGNPPWTVRQSTLACHHSYINTNKASETALPQLPIQDTRRSSQSNPIVPRKRNTSASQPRLGPTPRQARSAQASHLGRSTPNKLPPKGSWSMSLTLQLGPSRAVA